jgi:hypothetical protein
MKAPQEKIELEKLLENSVDKIDSNVPKTEDTAELKGEPLFTDDLGKLNEECEKQARKMIHTSTGFMLSDEIIKQNPYMKDKMKIDIMSLAGMIYQLKTNELMQKTLMEEIRHGAAHPRMFEVFGQLSKTVGDLNKQLLQTVEAIKVTYRDIKQDVRDKDNELKALTAGGNGLLRNEKGTVAIGTKDLIKSMKSLRLKNEEDNINIEDINIVNNEL